MRPKERKKLPWIWYKCKLCFEERRLPNFISKFFPSDFQQNLPLFLKRKIALAECQNILKEQKQRDLEWEILPACPERLHDPGSAQIGSHLYVICGYVEMGQMHNKVEVFDFKKGRWIKSITTPKTMAQSHLGVAVEGDRYLYIISGQQGPHCSPAVANAFVFDTKKEIWKELPPLAKPRYSPSVVFWRGRIHLMGGSKEDRYTPATDHWSLRVKDGQAQDSSWQKEVPLPRGGPHRCSAIIHDKLYVFGGQEGDYKPVEGTRNFICDHTAEERVFPDTYMFVPESQKWLRKADMLVGVSHVEYSFFLFGGKVYFVGGQTSKDPDNFQLQLTDVIQEYNPVTDKWRVVGHSPYRIKGTAVGYYQGYIYQMVGQRDLGPEDPSTGKIVSYAWRAKFQAA